MIVTIGLTIGFDKSDNLALGGRRPSIEAARAPVISLSGIMGKA
jgi:hypothetical protein